MPHVCRSPQRTAEAVRFLGAGTKGGYEPPVTDAGPQRSRKRPGGACLQPLVNWFFMGAKNIGLGNAVFFINTAGKSDMHM